MNTMYQHIKTVENADPGYSPNAGIALLTSFEPGGIKVPVASVPQVAGDKKTIKTSHEFAEDEGIIAVYCAPKGVEGDAELVGEQLAKRFKWMPKITIVGDSAALLETVEGILNSRFLLFVKDAECGTNEYIQFGSECNPCIVDAGSFKSGTSADGRKQYEFTIEAFCKYFYKGVLTEKEL